jgi:DNA-binding NarL/FixJ family response regulator
MTKSRHRAVDRVQLTPRERQIAGAVAAGLTNRAIASRLGISEKTVRNRLTVLFEKLHVRGRLQLAMLLTAEPEIAGRVAPKF